MKRKSASGKMTSFYKNSAGMNIDEEQRCVVCRKLVRCVQLEAHTVLCIERHTSQAATQAAAEEPDRGASPQGGVFSRMLQASKLGAKTTLKFRLDVVDGKIVPLLFFPSEIESIRSTYYSSSGSGGATSSRALPTAWQSEVKVKNVNLLFGPGAPSGACISVDGISTADFSHLEDLVVKVQTNIRPNPNPNPNMKAKAASPASAPAAATDAPVHPSVYKSILQKLVRRRQGNSAVRIALELAETAPLEFLRRDSVLHPLYPVLVWVMVAAGKGYAPPDPLLALCLSIVGGAAACPYRDISSSTLLDYTSSPLHEELSGDDGAIDEIGSAGEGADSAECVGGGGQVVSLKTVAPSAARSLLLSILLRGSFGGMVGDLAMLTTYARLWFGRLFRGGGVAAVRSSTMDAYVHPQYISDLYSCGFWGVRIVALVDSSTASEGSSDSSSLPRALAARVVECLRQELCHARVDYCSLGAQPLTRTDVLPAGIDFHVERGLIPFLLDCCEDAVEACLGEGEYAEEALKSVIWYFSSSVSNHRAADASFVADTGDGALSAAERTDRRLVSLEEATTAEVLAKKRGLARVWTIVAGKLAAYTGIKADELFRRYVRSRQKAAESPKRRKTL